jgi:hypothetical protein
MAVVISSLFPHIQHASADNKNTSGKLERRDVTTLSDHELSGECVRVIDAEMAQTKADYDAQTRDMWIVAALMVISVVGIGLAIAFKAPALPAVIAGAICILGVGVTIFYLSKEARAGFFRNGVKLVSLKHMALHVESDTRIAQAIRENASKASTQPNKISWGVLRGAHYDLSYKERTKDLGEILDPWTAYECVNHLDNK